MCRSVIAGQCASGARSGFRAGVRLGLPECAWGLTPNARLFNGETKKVSIALGGTGVQKIRLDRCSRVAFAHRWPFKWGQGRSVMKLTSLFRATAVGALSLFAA